MTLHYLDIIVYLVCLVLIYILAPQDYKYELGFLALFFIYIIFTIIYVIIFGFIDFNVIDIWNACHFSVQIEK